MGDGGGSMKTSNMFRGGNIFDDAYNFIVNKNGKYDKFMKESDNKIMNYRIQQIKNYDLNNPKDTRTEWEKKVARVFD